MYRCGCRWPDIVVWKPLFDAQFVHENLGNSEMPRNLLRLRNCDEAQEVFLTLQVSLLEFIEKINSANCIPQVNV